MSASTTTTAPDNSAAGTPPAAYSFTRLLYWGVRRELWENRSIYIAPLVAAGLLVLAVVITLVEVVGNAQPLVTANIRVDGDVGAAAALWVPYMIIAAPILGISLLVAVAYCLGALHGERRDRSILFWKSLPVSDLTTVLSKACIPVIIVPLVSFLVAMITQWVIFAIALSVFPLFAAKAHIVWASVPVSYRTVRMIWAGVPVGYLTLAMFYGVLATALWQAPIYAWLLLVGGWAKRMSFVWATVPVIGLMIAERIVFGTVRLETMLDRRLYGSVSLAFSDVVNDKMPAMTPVHFLSDPGLWIGLAVSALFLGAAVLMRRYRQPI